MINKTIDMNTKRLLMILLVCVVGSLTVTAQDVIIKKNGDKVRVVVKEINDTQIKYVEFDDPNEILFTMDRALIKEIKFSYGKKYKEEAPTEVSDYFSEDGQNNLMLNFTAFGNDAIILTYERALNAGSSFDISTKILGVGIDDQSPDYDKSGFGLDLGYKLKFGSVFKKSGEYRPKHLLHGGYFKPSIGFAFAEESRSFRSEKYSYGHFGLQVGKQWILQNRISLDIYFGFHYYIGDSEYEYSDGSGIDVIVDDADFNDGDLAGDSNRAAAFGLRVGYVFGKYGFKGKKNRR